MGYDYLLCGCFRNNLFSYCAPKQAPYGRIQKMLNSLKVGNRVLAAGIYGVVKKIGETTVDVEVAKGVVVVVAKNAIANVEK